MQSDPESGQPSEPAQHVIEPNQAQKIVSPQNKFPPSNFPALYIDGFLNISYGPQIARLYAYRLTPSLHGDNTYEAQPAVQLIMSMEAFITTATSMSVTLATLEAQDPNVKAQADMVRAGIGVSKS